MFGNFGSRQDSQLNPASSFRLIARYASTREKPSDTSLGFSHHRSEASADGPQKDKRIADTMLSLYLRRLICRSRGGERRRIIWQLPVV